MNFKQAATHVFILSVIQRGALQTHCIQHWGTYQHTKAYKQYKYTRNQALLYQLETQKAGQIFAQMYTTRIHTSSKSMQFM